MVDDHTFTFGFDEFKPVTYVFVKDATDYISRAVLVGKDQDKQGRAYEFKGDGWAIFPDRKFKFEIGTDPVFNGYDYFKENTRTWAFKWNGSHLQIFPTIDVEGFDQIALALRTSPCGKCDRWPLRPSLAPVSRASREISV